jgi:hypothetical protein
MFGFVKKALIRLARKVVQGVMSQLMQQLNVVQDQALAPMRTMVQAVIGGIWIGEGANAFVEEVSNLMIPGVGQVMDNISFIHKGVSAFPNPDAANDGLNHRPHGSQGLILDNIQLLH